MDLLQHVVPIVAFVDIVTAELHANGRAHDIARIDTPHREPVGGDLNQVAFFEKDEPVGHRAQREHVRRKKVLADADPDNQRTADACADQPIGFVARHDADRVGAFEVFDRKAHGVEQTASIDLQRFDQMRDDLRVGVGVELIAVLLQFQPDLFEVLDDAVVHHADPISRHVWMCVAFERRTVRRPSRVRDTDVAEQRVRAQAIGELFDLADAAPAFDADRAVRDHREPRRVIAAILQPLEAFEQDPRDVPARDGANNAAHGSVFPVVQGQVAIEVSWRALRGEPTRRCCVAARDRPRVRQHQPASVTVDPAAT